MFKLKPGNVFQKMNKMDRKQAYTLGAIVVVVFVALITMASFFGKADDSSFEDYNSRGYDLAQMPFVNDEAEEYLLASKYPDMQGNNSTMLYSSSEKEERQAEDAAQAEEEAATSDTLADSSSADSSYPGYSGRGYSGRGGARTPTQIGQLGSASMRGTGGSGISATWGAPKGDFSPYKSQDKGTEAPLQLKNTDAKKALSQFARGSAAAAGLKDGKSINAKRALMGAGIKGSEAFSETGSVDLSKAGGLNLDTNAPVSSADLSNLDKKIDDAAKKGKDEKKKEEENLGKSFGTELWQKVLTAAVDFGMQKLSQGVDMWIANGAAKRAGNKYSAEVGREILNKDFKDLTAEERSLYASAVNKPVTELPKEGSTRSFYREQQPATSSKSSSSTRSSSGSDRSTSSSSGEKDTAQTYQEIQKQERQEERSFGRSINWATQSGAMADRYQAERDSAYNAYDKSSKRTVFGISSYGKDDKDKKDNKDKKSDKKDNE